MDDWRRRQERAASPFLRNDLRPGDVGAIVRLHGLLYAKERGWDATFEAYVAGPLSEFVLSHTDREKLWIAETADRIVGCIAIVTATPDCAQLRWYLVDPAARGAGLGSRLLSDALAFCKAAGYREVMLWTEQSLAAAAHLYLKAGFRKIEEKAGTMWGAAVVEEKYTLRLG